MECRPAPTISGLFLRGEPGPLDPSQRVFSPSFYPPGSGGLYTPTFCHSSLFQGATPILVILQTGGFPSLVPPMIRGNSSFQPGRWACPPTTLSPRGGGYSPFPVLWGAAWPLWVGETGVRGRILVLLWGKGAPHPTGGCVGQPGWEVGPPPNKNPCTRSASPFRRAACRRCYQQACRSEPACSLSPGRRRLGRGTDAAGVGGGGWPASRLGFPREASETWQSGAEIPSWTAEEGGGKVAWKGLGGALAAGTVGTPLLFPPGLGLLRPSSE